MRIVRIVAVAGPLLLVASMFVAAEATKSNTFCGLRCHEMTPYYRTWEVSAHQDVDCVGCHIPHGVWSYVKTKVFGLREVWVHVTDKVEKPIAVTRHIPDDTCIGCHPPDEVIAPVRLARWTTSFEHRSHVKETACIACHARLVHPTIEGVPNVEARSMEACFSCHDGTTQPDRCEYCHESAPHPERGACEDCHALESWTSEVRHQPPLVDRHGEILCERCHATTTPAEIGRPVGCIDCHRPSHSLQMASLSLRRCADCHVITHWRPNTFEHPRTDCVSCHGNEHGSPSLDQCEDCHSQTAWAGGRHPTSGCVSCHGNEHGSPSFDQCQDCHSQTTWAGARHPTSDCTTCHSPGRLHSGLGSACQTCHVSGAYWSPSTFQHQQVGEHVPSGEHRLTCTECHKTTYASATCTPCHGPGGPGGD